MNVKWAILINQSQVVNYGLDEVTDVIDWCILDYLKSLAEFEKVVVIDGEYYTYLDYNRVLEEMPLLKISLDELVERINKLFELGLIDLVQEEGKPYYRLTRLYYRVMVGDNF